jgi:hypothetical protein
MYPKINIGDFGYQFRKEFDSGWFNGKVVKNLPRALSGWDRRCVYEVGDCEDLMFDELKRLATLSLQENLGTIEVVGDVGMSEEGCGKCLKVEKIFDLAERKVNCKMLYLNDILYDSGANWLEENLKSVCVSSP